MSPLGVAARFPVRVESGRLLRAENCSMSALPQKRQGVIKMRSVAMGDIRPWAIAENHSPRVRTGRTAQEMSIWLNGCQLEPQGGHLLRTRSVCFSLFKLHELTSAAETYETQWLAMRARCLSTIGLTADLHPSGTRVTAVGGLFSKETAYRHLAERLANDLLCDRGSPDLHVCLPRSLQSTRSNCRVRSGNSPTSEGRMHKIAEDRTARLRSIILEHGNLP
jgi:hypothetical protein